MRKRYCIITNDVETTSILNHQLSKEAGYLVYKQGMPRLIAIFNKYGVKSTFFFCGDIVQLYPEVVKMVLEGGHEVASHGWDHEPKRAFDVLPIEDQINHLKLSKEKLENICNKKVISFRAPVLRVNGSTEEALSTVGFKIDSSVSSQRMDMFLSFGAIKKLKWILAPRRPYYTKKKNLFAKGNGSVFEIPVSALGLGYIGTTLRIWPSITSIIRYLLHFESIFTGKPIVFLTHPNEFIDEIDNRHEINRRGTNFISYLLGDLLRRKLKLKNLGSKALPLLEREISFFKKRNYEFVTCEMYYNINQEKNNNASK